LQRSDLARIFNRVQKRPRITEFNDFGGRTPSDKPPVKTRGELAKERGEPWPPAAPTPAPVPSTVSSAGTTNGAGPHGNGQPYGAVGAPGSSNDGPPYYGAPPGWTPATTPQGQSWAAPWDSQPSGVQDAVPGKSVDTDERDATR
ncbi:MAG TPA: cell division protein FtsH, partial [Pseudonocardiaceae bacterium]|nr:cell division protein FtsH [Pseudonocardiaceae bacterium]